MKENKTVRRITKDEENEMDRNTIFFADYADVNKEHTKEELAEIYGRIMDDIANGVRKR